jgi:CRP-like cAMP-binding protein
LFLAINLFWIVVIYRQRQPPKMTTQEQRLFDRVFKRSCTARQMLALLAVAEKESLHRGVRIIDKGGDSSDLLLIEEGYAEVVTPGDEIIRLGNGDFVGEMSFLTGLPPVTDVIADSAIKFYRWSKADLQKLYEKNTDLKAALNEAIARDLTRKLTSEHLEVPELSVTMMVKDM